jgi:hypothetical protein
MTNINYICVMRYNSSNFYNGVLKRFTLTNEDIEMVRKLKPVVEESGYYNFMLVWKFNDCEDIVGGVETFNRLYMVMQFLTMTAEIGEIKSIKVEKYHEILLRGLYLEYDDFDEPTITMGYKRPFGNSYVIGDVKKAYLDTKTGINDLPDEDCERILEEFSIFLAEFLTTCKVKYSSFVWGENKIYEIDNGKIKRFDYLGCDPHSYIRWNWDVDLQEIRELKINKILDEGI